AALSFPRRPPSADKPYQVKIHKLQAYGPVKPCFKPQKI
ncbi:hypothetical protein AB205_0198300, partial [Aquarana catesbeiana]